MIGLGCLGHALPVSAGHAGLGLSAPGVAASSDVESLGCPDWLVTMSDIHLQRLPWFYWWFYWSGRLEARGWVARSYIL